MGARTQPPHQLSLAGKPGPPEGTGNPHGRDTNTHIKEAKRSFVIRIRFIFIMPASYPYNIKVGMFIVNFNQVSSKCSYYCYFLRKRAGYLPRFIVTCGVIAQVTTNIGGLGDKVPRYKGGIMINNKKKSQG